jgi:kynureninase
MSRSDAELLDRDDPLASRRRLFSLPDGLVYLDGNSLGPLTTTVASRLRDAVRRQWGTDLIRSWNDNGWWDAPVRIGERIAPLVGAAPGQVVVCDSTTVNLFKLVTVARALRPHRSSVVVDPEDFPTDRYVVAGIAADLNSHVDENTAVAVLSHVDYRTGSMRDLRAVTAEVHGAGGLVVWDLSHSVGAVPVGLDDADADFAVGCTYKYLNGGPGAPSFCYAAHRHQNAIRTPIQGWHGHARPFEMEAAYAPDPGVRRLLAGTVPMLSLVALDAALDAFDGVDMDVVRAKSVALGEYFTALVAERLASAGFGVVSPRDPAARGSQVCLGHPDAYAIVQALTARNVIGDFRTPDVLRFGFCPLYLRFVDVWDAVDRLVTVMDREEWRDDRYAVRATVT